MRDLDIEESTDGSESGDVHEEAVGPSDLEAGVLLRPAALKPYPTLRASLSWSGRGIPRRFWVMRPWVFDTS